MQAAVVERIKKAAGNLLPAAAPQLLVPSLVWRVPTV
jgi:hypothetical protein